MTILKRLLVLFVMSVILLIAAYLFPYPRLVIEQVVFNLLVDNPPVENVADLDAILAEFEVVARKDLPQKYLAETKIADGKYDRLSPAKFYVIHKKDLYRKIAGNTRIRDVFPVDDPARAGWYFSEDELYWGIDKNILYKLLDLRKALNELGYDGDQLRITYGYRHPARNEKVRGASASRHIAGDAVDFVVQDVNQDGSANLADKDIVLKICERELIGNLGGIGLYPGTQVIHIDLRGKRARWDSY